MPSTGVSLQECAEAAGKGEEMLADGVDCRSRVHRISLFVPVYRILETVGVTFAVRVVFKLWLKLANDSQDIEAIRDLTHVASQIIA